MKIALAVLTERATVPSNFKTHAFLWKTQFHFGWQKSCFGWHRTRFGWQSILIENYTNMSKNLFNWNVNNNLFIIYNCFISSMINNILSFWCSPVVVSFIKASSFSLELSSFSLPSSSVSASWSSSIWLQLLLIVSALLPILLNCSSVTWKWLVTSTTSGAVHSWMHLPITEFDVATEVRFLTIFDSACRHIGAELDCTYSVSGGLGSGAQLPSPRPPEKGRWLAAGRRWRRGSAGRGGLRRPGSAALAGGRTQSDGRCSTLPGSSRRSRRRLPSSVDRRLYCGCEWTWANDAVLFCYFGHTLSRRFGFFAVVDNLYLCRETQLWFTRHCN